MALSKTLEKFRAKVQTKSEEMAAKREIEQIKGHILHDFIENNPLFAKPYLYWEMSKDGKIEGYKVVECEVESEPNKPDKYKPIKQVTAKNGSTLFTLEELAEFDHARTGGVCFHYYGSNPHDHAKIVRECKIPAAVSIIKQRLGNTSAKK